MPDSFDDILDQAEQLTLGQLDSKISSLTRLKDSELSSWFPAKADKQKLLQLMQIVQSASSDNEKKAELIKNIESVASVVITMLSKVV